jgi:hypothetical protein
MVALRETRRMALKMLCCGANRYGANDVVVTVKVDVELFSGHRVTSCKSFNFPEPILKTQSNHPPVHVFAQRSAVGGASRQTGS